MDEEALKILCDINKDLSNTDRNVAKIKKIVKLKKKTFSIRLKYHFESEVLHILIRGYLDTPEKHRQLTEIIWYLLQNHFIIHRFNWGSIVS